MKRALLLAVAAGVVALGAGAAPTSASSLQIGRPIVEQRTCAVQVGVPSVPTTCLVVSSAP